MSLGYALLHADRIEAAITGVSEGQVAADEGVDIGVAALALERPESLIQDYVRGVITQFEAFVARIQGAFESGAGVLGEIRRALDSLLELDLDSLRLTPLVDGLVELVSALDPAVLGPRIREFCERLLVVFPELSGGELLETILDIALGGLEVLEGPRLSGRDDIAAHRSFRAARIARAWIAKTLAPVREFLGDLDLHAVICGGVQTLIAQLEFDGGALRQIAEGVRDFLRPVAVAVDALLELRVSVSISVNASASAGAQGMPGEDGEVLWLDDTRVTPHGPDHGLWWTDLLTNVASLGWGVFDVVNYGPYASGRAWDGILCTLGLVWKGVRGLVRALRPDFLCDEQWNTGGAFWFSELGDFCIHAFLATVEALIYEGGRLANLVMSIAVRLGRYYTFTVGPRLPYIIARAIWYARSWKEDGWVIEHEVAAGETLEQIAAAHGVEVDELRRWNRLGADESPEVGRTLLIVPDERGEAPGRVRPPISFTRYSWLGWGFMYLFGMIGGLIQPWDRFEVEKFADAGEGGGWWAFSRWLVFGLGLIAAIVGPWLIFGAWPWDRHYEVDGLTFAVYVGTMLFVALVAMGSMYSTNVTRDSWWVMLIVIGVVLAMLITVAVLWANEGDDELLGATHVLYWFSLIIGAVLFGLLPIILWMYYVQDGRDKEGLFAGMATKRGVTPTQLREAAPYKLPYPQGETWNCGQGVHGMWSHVTSSIGNLYSYDFLELQDKPSLAARGGMVVEIVQSNPYNNPTQNDVIIQHLDWSHGHDPGTEDERVQTFSDYIHIGPDCAHIDVGQRVVQGQHIINIDSTGISAQHHLHFGASASADYSHTIPVVFADDSLQTARGFAHDPGRPRSGCLYTSDNPKVAAPARPIQLETVAASPRGEASAHHHTLDIDVDQLELDGRPRGGTLRLQTSQDHGHRHEVEIDAATLARLLDHEAPGELTTASAMSGELAHTHRFEPEARAGGAPGGKVRMPVAWVSVTQPPTAQAMARSAGPYDLRAHQIVARVDDCANAFLFFAAERASVLGELCLGRGPNLPNLIAYGAPGSVTERMYAFPDRRSVCDAAHELNARIGSRPWVVRPVPVLVIETRARGSAAQLEIDCDPSNTAFGISGIVDARGHGFDPHAVSRAALIARCEQALNQAPAAAPPSAVTASARPSWTTLDFGGAAVSVSAGPRAQTIFAGLYDAGHKRLEGGGTLPFGAGRITLSGGGKTLEVPIAGAPAWVELDQGPAWLSPAHINATPLHVKVNDSEVRVSTDASDPSLGGLAARIMTEVEGVRAWDQGGKLRIETVDVGSRLSLSVTKAKPEGEGGSDFSTSTTGESPRLGASSGIDDSALLRRSELAALIHDAATREGQRHGRPAAIAAGTQVAVGVRFEADKLELSVPRGHTIELDRANCCQALLRRIGPAPADGADPNFEAATLANGRKVIRSKVLGATPDLGGGGWLDVKVDGAVRRVWLDGAPARIELGADEAWTSSGGSLKRRLGGAGAWTTIELAAMPSLTRLAGAIGGGGSDLAVRVAYRLAFESAFAGGQGVELEEQRETYGVFSRARVLDNRGGPAQDCARAEGQGEAALSPDLRWVVGEPKPGYASAVTGPANAQVLELSGAGFNLRVHPATVDPFAFTVDGAKAKTGAFAPEGRAMGRRVLRYRVDMRATGGGADRQTWLQLVAGPASVRAAGPVAAWLLDGEAKLDVEVYRGAARTQVEVELGWAAGLARTLAARPNATASEVAAAVRERLVATIQREVPMVRAWFVPEASGARTRLQLETVGAGTGWKLRMTGGDVLRALGFDDAAISAAGVLEVLGVGNVADEGGVRADELRAAFDAAAAFTCELGPGALPSVEAHVLGAFARRYTAQREGKRAYLRLRSTSDGCSSSLAVLDGGAAFDFEPSLLRAPACNAAVVLPPPAATVTFAAAETLTIRFDAGSSSPATVSLNLAAGTYDRTQLIAALRQAVVSAGAGKVARFPDDKVVIETDRRGLQGAVEVPHTGSSAAIVAAFGLSAASPSKARGWPGQRQVESLEDFSEGRRMPKPRLGHTQEHVPARGYRSRPISAAVKPKKDVRWRFRSHNGTIARTSPELKLEEGWSAQTLAARVDQILRQGAPGNVRIGRAYACPDGSVQIEAASGGYLYFEFADAGETLGPPGVDTPNPHTGERVDIKADPGLDLRMSDTLRTYRCVHDLRGEARTGEAGDFIDIGWHRPPTSATWGIPRSHTKSGSDVANYPIRLSAWPWGRVLLSARAEAAKADAYADAAAMIVSAGTHDGVTFVHAARYWVGLSALDGGTWLRPLQLGVRTFAGEVLVDWVL